MALLRFCLPLALVLLVNVPAAAQKPDLAPLETTLKRIAGAARGRIGFALIHLESGATLHVRGDERFPMASIVKLPIAIEVLKQVAATRADARSRGLARREPISGRAARSSGAIRKGASRGLYRELLELAILESDNTAADALLKVVGGPEVVERRLRAMGFQTINVDRSEGQLLLDMAGVTSAPPPEQWTIELQRRLVAEVDRESLSKGRARYLTDQRDTATPYETAQLLGRLQLGDLLPRAETDLLLSHMLQTKTGMRRIKGRLPPETLVAHKTGTTAVVINDAGIITLPADSKIAGQLVVAVFVADGSSIARMERSVAQMSAAAFEFFTGRTIPRRPVQPRRQR